MGHFPQGGEKEQNVSFVKKKNEALFWLNGLIFSSFLNSSEEIISVRV